MVKHNHLPGKIAVIGTNLPRRCGIATFTHDTVVALKAASKNKAEVAAIAMLPSVLVDHSVDAATPSTILIELLSAVLRHVFDACLTQPRIAVVPRRSSHPGRGLIQRASPGRVFA